MDLDILKVYASTYISESDIPFDEKIDLINFVKIAEKEEVLSLLATGSPILTENETLLQYTEMVIDEGISDRIAGKRAHNVMIKSMQKGDNFGKTIGKGLRSFDRTKKGVQVAGAVGVAAIIAAAYAVYKRFLSQAATACGGKSGGEKTACMNAYKKKAYQAQIAQLNKGLSNCPKGDDAKANTCRSKIHHKIISLKKKVSKL